MRIFLHPGYVISVNDGDRHYIDANQLAALYGLTRFQCQVLETPIDHLRYHPEDGDQHLYPDPQGRYEFKVPA